MAPSGRALAGQVDEALGDVDAVDRDAPPGQLVGVAAGTAADVEHPHARLEPEGVDEEVDLLLGALGEGVAEVGRAEVVGDRLEPVVGLRASVRRHRAPSWRARRPLAGARFLLAPRAAQAVCVAGALLAAVHQVVDDANSQARMALWSRPRGRPGARRIGVTS